MKVTFTDVYVRLSEKEIVQGASMEVKPGHVFGLIGPNGSGKSTLLRTLYRAIVPSEGSVKVDGNDVHQLSPRQAAKTVAVMLQDPATDFDLSVEEVVMLGRAPHHSSFGRDTPEDVSIVQNAMERTHTLELADRMLTTLSGGQLQRVMLARALAQQTPVLVLDEPSNHLDISYQHELMYTVKSLGTTVIAALHDINLASQYCDEIAVLKDGKIVAVGKPKEVLTPELIRSTFRIDARILGADDNPVFAFQPLPK